MLRIDQIRLLPGDSEALLPGKCARILRLPAEDIVSCAVLRRAIDAREGLTLVYTAAVEVKREDTCLLYTSCLCWPSARWDGNSS